MQHLFIINKFAGKNERYKTIINQLEILNPENCTIKYTDCPGDATSIARDFVTGTNDFVNVYACGGDGTINEVLNGIYGLENCALAPVPTGSGNDFVRNFNGITKADFLDLDKLMNGELQSIDLIKCNDKVGVNCVSIGFDCAVAKNVEKFKKMKLITSSFAYKISTLYCLFSQRKHSFEIYGDSKKLPDFDSNTYLLSVTAKSKFYGGGIKCAPNADNFDGMLDFISIETVGLLKFIMFFTTYIKGNHIDNPRANFVFHNKYKEIEYRSNTPIELGIDGEIFSTTSAKISVLPHALKVLLPKQPM